MEEPDKQSVSSASGSQTTCDVVEDEHTVNLDDETEFKEALERLDDIKFDPDRDISAVSIEESGKDTDSIGATSSASSQDRDETRPQAAGGGGAPEKSGKSSPKEKPKKTKDSKKISVFDRLKRLTKFDKTPKPSSYSSEFTQVKIDKLPQVFVAKYLGKHSVAGLFGLQYVRKPVDDLVGKVKKQLETQETMELPLAFMVISRKGIDIREHRANKIKDGIPCGLIPIDFISYGVQDIKYWRVFAVIVVSELSLRTKKLECHVFICDSTVNARRMALSLGAAFHLFRKQLQSDGKVHNFQVELRPPDELAEMLVTSPDCEA